MMNTLIKLFLNTMIVSGLVITSSIKPGLPQAKSCPLGTFDGFNCYLGPVPKTGFVYQEKSFYMKYDQCSIGKNDGLNCFLNVAPAGTKAFIYKNQFYTTPLRNQCVLGTFDGTNCFVNVVPAGTKAFIYKNQFYTTPLRNNQCVLGTFDGTNCFVNVAPAGTKAFIYKNQFYTTPLPLRNNQCVLGTFDGTNCYVGPVPKTGFVYQQKSFYMKYDQCSLGKDDGLNCLLNVAPAGTIAYIDMGGFYTTPFESGAPTSRTITVSSEGSGPSTLFTVSGKRFTPNRRVVVRITDDQFRQIEVSETVERSGSFVSRRSVASCTSGAGLTFTAFEDDNPTGTFANVVVTSCP